MDFQVWDLPGQIDYLDSSFDTDSIFSGVGAMVWVLDAVDNYMEPIGRLTDIILHLQKSYPHIKYTVFIHKIDSLTEDIREETIRDVVQRISDELFDAGVENPPINYYGTSIFDHTIFEGLSRVMQGLVPQLPTFEALLNTMRASCHFEKVYLFDVYSKIYIASDTSPLDVNSYELCSDYIDLIVDMSEVYGWHRNKVQGSEAPQIPETQFAESHVANIKGYHLYLREINMSVFPRHVLRAIMLILSRNLAFIGISKDPNFEAGKSVRDQNIQTFQDTLLQILARAQQPEQMDQSASSSATTGHSQLPV